MDRLPRQWARFDVIQHSVPPEECVGMDLRLLAPGERAFIQDRRQILCVNREWPAGVGRAADGLWEASRRVTGP